MSEELLKIADGLLAVSEGVRALAGKAHSCNCSKNQEEERGQKDEESGNEKSQEKQENAVMQTVLHLKSCCLHTALMMKKQRLLIWHRANS